MELNSFVYSSGQKFSCRDCPSRCCKNWTVDVSASDVERFQKESWVRERLVETGASFLQLGADHFLLPVIEVDRQMRCAFLESDGLCGLHRRFGHDFLAATCQTFPFDFIEGADEKIIVVTSRVCPSIRDNYGDPLASLVAEKFRQSGGLAKKQSPYMSLGPKTRLDLVQYNAILNKWEELIAGSASLPLGLALCFRLIEALASRWSELEQVEIAEFQQGLIEAGEQVKGMREQTGAELAKAAESRHLLADVMMVLSCLPLTYPLRSRVLFQGLAKAKYLSGVLASLLALLRMKGTIDIMHLGAAIPLHPSLRDEGRGLGEREWNEIRDYTLQILARRKFAMQPKSLEEILFALGMVPGNYAFFARLRAEGRGGQRVDREDYRDAISALDMAVLHQRGFLGSSRLFQMVLPLIVANPKTFFSLLVAGRTGGESPRG